MERAVDFNRDRRMLCGQCGQEWTVDLAWIERWSRGDEACPRCGTASEAENAARVTVSDDDPALDDATVAHVAWYHTSTYAEWPTTVDFVARLDDNVRRMMGDEGVSRWAHRQSTKALHLGTYESAIHNMLRRINDQGDNGSQFYLYRVHLKPEAVILPGWTIDPSDFMGDVNLDDIAPAEVEAVRYVNYHEDPGRLSLAIRPSAIGTTQCVAIPFAARADEPWIVETADRLSADPPDPFLPLELRSLAYVFGSSARAETARAATHALVEQLPINLQWQFEAATRWDAESEPSDWARYTFGLAALVEDSARVLAALDAQPNRHHH